MLENEITSEFLEKESSFVRDRIVVLGRPQAGKTVYLSLLYDLLWSSKSDLKMKAEKGAHHSNFIKEAAKIKSAMSNGKKEMWSPATIETTQPHLEIRHEDKTMTMVALDYSGEVFQNAFINDIFDSEQVRDLLDHIDHARAVILLVDPEHVAGSNVESAIDNTLSFCILRLTIN